MLKPDLIQRLQNHFDECYLKIANDSTLIRIDVESMITNDTAMIQSSGNDVDVDNNHKNVIHLIQKQYHTTLRKRETKYHCWFVIDTFDRFRV